MTANELSEQRDFLLRSIDDLDREHEAGDIAEADYRALRDEYTARAAQVLRTIEAPPGSGPDTAATATATTSARTSASTRTRMLWILGVLALALGAGWLVATSAGERVAGDSATGSIPEASTDRIANAQRLVREGDVIGAVKVYDELLDDDPENPVALAERGWLISRVDPTLVDRGLAGVEKAIALDPGYAEAHFYRGMILLRSKNDAAAAAAAFETALESDPPPDLKAILDDLLQEARQGGGG